MLEFPFVGISHVRDNDLRNTLSPRWIIAMMV